MDIASLFRLDEKRVLITGSSSGIGQLQALAMISVGARVVVHGSNQAKIDETLQMLGAAGGEAHGVCLALDGSRSNAQDLVRQAAELLGGLDIVINCAGTNRRKEIEDVTDRRHRDADPSGCDVTLPIPYRTSCYHCEVLRRFVRHFRRTHRQ